MPKKEKPKKAKLRTINPTFRQKIAFDKLTEIVRKPEGRKGITIGKILKEAGYSTNIQKQPSRVTKSQGWQLLMDKHLSDNKLAKVHEGALGAQKIDHYIFPKSYGNKQITALIESFGFKVTQIRKQGGWKRAYFSHPDHYIRLAAVKEAYKLKAKYPQEQEGGVKVAVVNVVNYPSKRKPEGDDGKQED